jgi:FtsP/CotA-like multicopper oxidase with cupredoxin domain
MTDRRGPLLTRRQLLKAGGLTAFAAGAATLGPRLVGTVVQPGRALAADKPPNLKLVGTDGWISLPPSPSIFSTSLGVTTHPDSYAPPGFTTYIFGFSNATGLSNDQQFNLKNKAQHSAPLFWARQEEDFRVQITNVGLAQRPDLFDEHTLHWHGFKNVIPFFDGEPTGSISVPQGQTFTYVYVSHDPGTYMYHCHVEDTEHVHMGMTGLVFVRPSQDGNTSLYPSGRYAYNDGDGSTGFDREFAMFCSEVWGDSHWADAHIQLPEWTDYRADFALLNGRVYPDTLCSNGSTVRHGDEAIASDRNYDAVPVRSSGTGWELAAPRERVGPGPADLVERPDLVNQPNSSLVTCNAGEHVLLRFANLGFTEAAMTLAGIKLRVVGRDATLMRGRTGFGTAYETNTVSFGAGESIDAIFEAPAFSGGSGSSGLGYDTYVLYNRAYTRTDNLAQGGGQRTEVRVYPAGSLAVQQYPNQHPDDPA